MGDELTHLDEQGRARMVNVGEKAVTHRVCVARGEVRMQPETLARIVEGRVAKGDVLATARIAGIQAAKRTGEWIPLAHPMPIDSVEVVLEPAEDGRALRIEARVEAHWKTGVEMEALVAASAAGLTVYDMCKAVDREMVVDRVRLVAKRGGKSGVFVRAGEEGVDLPD
ncbi:MAG: cyclic pyranopterin monophosphate synthase MoaC [Myxococcales bacterium]|nr:cyclic pyranopterin monophosphate synthase MoaC [Myxococcales bacterium]